MAEHKIAIRNRITTADAGILLICNNPTDTIRFEFDEEWSGIAAKTARFSWEGKYIDVPFSGNVVQVPEIFQTNYVRVGVFSDAITSTAAKLNCRFSIKCLGGKVVPPSEDVYAQIIALINAGIDANDGVGVSSAYVNDAGHLIITLSTGATIDCGTVKGENGKDGMGAAEYSEVKTRLSSLENYEQRPFEATGNPVQIDNFDGMPLNVVSVLEPIQSGTGDPRPSSKNLLPYIEETTQNGATITTQEDGGVHISGTPTANTFFYFDCNIALNGSYMFSMGNTEAIGDHLQMRLLDASGNMGNTNFNAANADAYTIVAAMKTIAQFVIRLGSGVAYDVTIYPMLEYGTTKTDFAIPDLGNIRPISGWTEAKLQNSNGETTNEYTADFGQTVYGGELDWQTGVLTVDRGFVTLTGSETLSAYTSAATGNGVSVSAVLPVAENRADGISSHALVRTSMDLPNRIVIGTNSRTVYWTGILDTLGMTTTDEFAAYLAAQYAAGTPVQIAYKLATPTTIQLTTQEIHALAGVNTLYGDGTLNVSGRKDILWLTSNLLARIAELETAVAALENTAATT